MECSKPPKICIVVPCYNEEHRLSVDDFRSYLDLQQDVFVLFVNDGSKDATLQVLRSLKSSNSDILDLEQNQGKAEAVRLGMLKALDMGFEYCGYWDADLATPLTEIGRFRRILDQNPHVHLVMGARVKLLGRAVSRRLRRHYLGRVFATFASLVLDLPVYDTQCGAKLFRTSRELRQVLKEPLKSRWIFDVELLARLKRHMNLQDVVYELPLEEWQDVAGSKLKARDFFDASYRLLWIYYSVLPGQSTRSQSRSDT